MQHDDKLPSVEYFKTDQKGVKAARSIVVIGGGAVGVRMATDINEVYPDKEVMMVSSRVNLWKQSGRRE
jgi:NADH dehydrogenase FAD-containing subunit